MSTRAARKAKRAERDALHPERAAERKRILDKMREDWPDFEFHTSDDSEVTGGPLGECCGRLGISILA